MSNEEHKAFEEWAVVEIMGHRRLAGRMTEVQIAGAGFLRVDVPDPKGEEGARAFTQLLSPNSIYAITPVTEEVARELARTVVEPVERWDVKRLLPTSESQTTYYEADYRHDDELDSDDDTADEPF